MTATSTPRPGGVSALLRWQLSLAHRLLDGTVERLPSEATHRHPPGTAAPAGACYAHAVLSEDLIVNGVLAGGQPLSLTTWAGQTGLSELPSLAGPISRPLSEPAVDWHPWSRRVQIDLAALRRYAQAVYAATDAHLATLPDEALDPARRELPGCLLNALLLTLATRRGEIAALLAIAHQPAASATSSGSPPDCCPLPPIGR